ncbi:competence type IV pilus major pilin ComGC [Tepidibacillus decaturensis]|uniref:Type II secretion system protein GspG C-terminal domain-containing protein n=1 Tax=Tepidibacillus decaturensis TaxID=1413211 RepID=A0A135L2X5_9BACI|nr:prepilin-type N-terminal cleavage/methylation domain-containing protein [Tepidibacillus decaturensis]KXG43247.1 hypothetical protein U473_03875 [Tepidibacillus decaturensis]
MRFKNEKGFTLIELLISIFIIGVILAISMPNLKASGEKAQAKACQANQKLIYVQMENYYLEHHQYPNQEGFLNELYKEQLLDQIPICSADGTYSYELVIDAISGQERLKIRCSIPEHNIGEE